MKSRRHRCSLIPALTVLVLVSTVPGWSDDRDRLAQAAAQVSAEQLRLHTTVLGSDALQGRAPGTLGGSRAAGYIARQLQKLGVRPVGDDGYFQMVPLQGATVSASSRLQLWRFGSATQLELGSDYLLLTTGAQTLIPRPVPMVFVGYGIVAPELDYNDYQDVDVRGKVVLYLAGEPRSNDPDYFAGDQPTVYSAMETKQRIALSRGAVGSILLPRQDDSTGSGWQTLVRELAFEQLSLAYSVPHHLNLILHPRWVEELFADSLYDLSEILQMEQDLTLRCFHLPVSLTFEGRFSTRTLLAPNVVGVVEGSHRRQRSTYVLLTAHYDHLGIGPPVAGDRIYNGVVDNAIGVAGLLEMVRVAGLPELRPNRSLMLLFTTAEESGSLGAQYFLDHPPVPLSQIVAAINVDGLAHRSTFDDAIGIGTELSDLGRSLSVAAAAVGLQVSQPPAEIWSRESFARSDLATLAEAGLPSIMINEGFSWHGYTREEAVLLSLDWMTNRYHSPTDDLEQPLSWQAARQHCGLILATTLEVADSLRSPQWRPGVPYAYQRLLSLASERAASDRHR
jgi:hypothetical protein